MEDVVGDDSPLAAYLQGNGDDDVLWDDANDTASDKSPQSTSPQPSFAPRGQPTVPPQYGTSLPGPWQRKDIAKVALTTLHDTGSKILDTRIRAIHNQRFLERFRYVIIASQLLSDHGAYGGGMRFGGDEMGAARMQPGNVSRLDLILVSFATAVLAYLVHWPRGASGAIATYVRAILSLTILVAIAAMGCAHIRRRWLQHLRQQVISNTTQLVSQVQSLNTVITASTSLIQEVELVSKGYRLSSPMAPVSRLEDRGQQRRCLRLRKALRTQFSHLLPRYIDTYHKLRPMAEAVNLEQYLDIYDISSVDIQDSQRAWTEDEFEDPESLSVLRILVARLYVARKIFLCCLLALDANGGQEDFVRWSTVMCETQALLATTTTSEKSLRKILSEEEDRPVPSTPRIPLTPGRERWRGQLRKLGALSSGIRSLQAKMHVLREESDRALDQSEELSELGPSLMLQYEGIGTDLKMLMQEWEVGKIALATNIDRAEKRISSMSLMSGMASPAMSLGGLTAVEEGSPLDALKALTGEGATGLGLRLSGEFSGSNSSDEQDAEVFEALALPRVRERSALTREERIKKVKEEREKRQSLQERREANTSMLRELESVINLRPRGKTMGSPTAHKARPMLPVNVS